MKQKHKTVLVTGGAVRVGRLIALSAAKAGADIVLHYGRSEEEAEKTAREIQALGRQVLIIQSDLNNPQTVAELVQTAAEWQELDVLVNNAAIFEALNFEGTTLEDWEKHIRINLTAPFLLSQAFSNHVGKERTGRIINILDWRVLRPVDDHFPYTISKSGLVTLTKSMAVALAPNIQVNGLALGAILPPSDGGDTSKAVQFVPAQRWATSEELEKTIQFLLEAPLYITGEIIHLDGGRHLI